MNFQEIKLSNIIIEKIINNPAQYLLSSKFKSIASNALSSNKIIAKILHQYASLVDTQIPSIFQLIPAGSIQISHPFSPQNTQIICTLWRHSLNTLTITLGNFKDVIFQNDPFKQLHAIRIERPSALTTSQLFDLCKLLPQNLREFTITYCEEFTNEIFEAIALHCPDLEILQIYGCSQVSSIPDVKLKKLRTLDVSETQIATISNWQLGNLTKINFSNTTITNEALTVIEKSCADTLVELDISNCPKITALTNTYKKLKILDIFNTGISISSVPLEILGLPNSFGKTFLHQACTTSQIELAKEFINRIEKLDRIQAEKILQMQDKHGETALMIAIKAELFYKQTVERDTPLPLGFTDVARRLIQLMEPNDLLLPNNQQRTVFELAVITKQYNLAKSIIKKIYEWNPRLSEEILKKTSPKNNTLLHLAVYNKLTDFASCLITYMNVHDLGIQNQSQCTALHLACYTQQIELIKILVEKISRSDRETQRRIFMATTVNGSTARTIVLEKNLLDVAYFLNKKIDACSSSEDYTIIEVD